MIDISKKSWQKYFLFGSLYFIEGIQQSLVMVIIPIYLLDKGFSVPVATLVAGVGGAPWYLKFVLINILAGATRGTIVIVVYYVLKIKLT